MKHEDLPNGPLPKGLNEDVGRLDPLAGSYQRVISITDVNYPELIIKAIQAAGLNFLVKALQVDERENQGPMLSMQLVIKGFNNRKEGE